MDIAFRVIRGVRGWFRVAEELVLAARGTSELANCDYSKC